MLLRPTVTLPAPRSVPSVPRGRLALALVVALGASGGGCSPSPSAPSGPPPVEPVFVAARDVFVPYGPKRGPDGAPARGAALRTKEAALAKAQDVRRRAVEPGASFADLAKAETDDPPAARESGFIGFVSTAAGFAEPLERALQALKDGE